MFLEWVKADDNISEDFKNAIIQSFKAMDVADYDRAREVLMDFMPKEVSRTNRLVGCLNKDLTTLFPSIIGAYFSFGKYCEGCHRILQGTRPSLFPIHYLIAYKPSNILFFIF